MCVRVSSFAPAYRGLVTRLFSPRRPDRPANQYVIAYDLIAFPSLVRFGVGNLDEWKGRCMRNVLCGRRAAQSGPATPEPSDKRRRPDDLGAFDGVRFLRSPQLDRAAPKMHVWIDLSWGPAHIAISDKAGDAFNRMAARSRHGVNFRTSRYFDHHLLGRYCMGRAGEYVDMPTPPEAAHTSPPVDRVSGTPPDKSSRKSV